MGKGFSDHLIKERGIAFGFAKNYAGKREKQLIKEIKKATNECRICQSARERGKCDLSVQTDRQRHLYGFHRGGGGVLRLGNILAGLQFSVRYDFQ